MLFFICFSGLYSKPTYCPNSGCFSVKVNWWFCDVSFSCLYLKPTRTAVRIKETSPAFLLLLLISKWLVSSLFCCNPCMIPSSAWLNMTQLDENSLKLLLWVIPFLHFPGNHVNLLKSRQFSRVLLIWIHLAWSTNPDCPHIYVKLNPFPPYVANWWFTS